MELEGGQPSWTKRSFNADVCPWTTMSPGREIYRPPGVHKGQCNGLSGLIVFEEHDIEKGASYNQRTHLTKVEATRCLSITSRGHDHSPRRPTPSHWLGTYTSEIPGQVTLTFLKRAHQCRESAAWSLAQVYYSAVSRLQSFVSIMQSAPTTEFMCVDGA